MSDDLLRVTRTSLFVYPACLIPLTSFEEAFSELTLNNLIEEIVQISFNELDWKDFFEIYGREKNNNPDIVIVNCQEHIYGDVALPLPWLMFEAQELW